MTKKRLLKLGLLQFILMTALLLPQISDTFFLEGTPFIAQAEDNSSDYDPTPNLRWNHDLMNVEQAWADGYTGNGITIAILDTGFYHRHPDLDMAGGYSVFADDAWSNDHSGHGTHIAGIIGARLGSTYPGIAPNANLYGIKIYHSADVDERGYVSTDVNSVIKGIRQAINIEADIIVISSGLTFDDQDLHDIIIEAHEAGILMIAASGNGNAAVNYPASYEEVIAVTAIDERMHPASDIIYGEENNFAAPGVNIGGLSIPGSPYSYPYIFMSGSSQATPHIAGLAAIIMEKHNVRGEEAREIMRSYATDIGDSNLYGNGLLHYVSDNETTQIVEAPDTNTDERPMEPPVEPSYEEQDTEARKPDASRQADIEVPVRDDESNYYQTDPLEQDGRHVLGYDVLPVVESGGTLEILLSDFTSIHLTEDQIREIRDRNIRLALTKNNVTWYIPPANFLSGEAQLHFYDGLPNNIQELRGAISPIFTISISQETVQRDTHPGWMELKFRITDLPETNFRKFVGYRWDPDEKEWAETLTDVGSEYIVLKTRQISSLGLFDPENVELAAEEEPVQVAEEEINPEESASTFIQSRYAVGAVVVISIILIIMLVKLYRHKQKD